MYAGSLFVGHCPAEKLVNHFYKMTKQLQVNGKHLLHLGMDGPKVDVKFEKDLSDGLKKKEDTAILNFGTCSLHPVQSVFKKGFQELDFGFKIFFIDLSFLFQAISCTP